MFVSYSHQDEEFLRRDSLLGFLSGLRHVGVEFWTDQEIPAGAAWDAAIRAQIADADVALLLVSQAFLDSEYVRDEELRLLLDRRRAQGLVVLPVLLSPCDWRAHPWLSSLQFLPRDGRTVKEDYRDEGARLRLYAQLRGELSEHAQRLRGARAEAEARARGERRWIATARCELRAVAGDGGPDERIEAVHRCAPALEALAAQVARRFDGQAVLAPPEVTLHFGHPTSHEDDPYRAARAALELARGVAAFPADADTGLRFAVRAGVDLALTVVDPGGKLTCADEADRVRLALREDGVAVTGRMVRLVRDRLTVEPVAAGDGFLLRSEGEGTPAAGGGAGDARPLLLGREPELALLGRQWARARAGQGALVTIRGERGVGKTQLLAALRYGLRGEPHRAIALRCSPLHDSRPLYPVLAHLEALVTDAGASPARALGAALAQDGLDEGAVLPAFERLMAPRGGAEDASPDPRAAQERRDVLETLCSWVLAIAEREPVLLAVEDVEWIDPSTVDLVSGLLDFVRDARVLVVATGAAEPPAAWTAGGEGCTVHLDRLGREHVEAMVAALDRDRRLPAQALPEILRATDGIPLYVEEYVRMLLEEPGRAAGGAVPATLTGILAQRLDAAGAARPFAQLAAAFGDAFDEGELLAVAAAAGLGDARPHLEALARAAVLGCQGRPGRRRYAFRHGLLRDAAYDTLLGSVRKQYHGLIADRLLASWREGPREGGDGGERPAAADASAIAHHLAAAGRKAQALPFWHRSARAAFSRCASQEAARDLERALQLVPSLPEPERARAELALRLDRGAVLIAVRGYAAPETEENYRRARELCGAAGDPAQAFAALWGAWSHAIVSADFVAAAELAEAVARAAAAEGSPAVRIERHHAVGVTHFNLGRFTEAVAELDAGLALCGAAGDGDHALAHGQDAAVAMRCWRALCLAYLGDLAAAQESVASALACAAGSHDPVSRIMARTFVGIVQDVQQDHAAAAAPARDAGRDAEAQDLPYWRAWADFVRAAADWERARAPEALAALEHAVAAYAATGARVWLPYMQLRLAACLAGAGRGEQARAAADEGMRLLGDARDRYHAAEVLALRAAVAEQAGERDRAQALLQEAWSVAARQRHRAAALRVVQVGARSGSAAVRERARAWTAELLGDPATAGLAAWRALLPRLGEAVPAGPGEDRAPAPPAAAAPALARAPGP